MKQLIKRPLVTEKNTYHNAAGVYVFEVDLSSDKKSIANEVQNKFGVKVDSVRTSVCRTRAKTTKFGLGKITHWKKALVKLKAGEKIAMFEGV